MGRRKANRLELIDVPREMFEVARDRTAFLMEPPGVGLRLSITDLLAMAYLNGISDAALSQGAPDASGGEG